MMMARIESLRCCHRAIGGSPTAEGRRSHPMSGIDRRAQIDIRPNWGKAGGLGANRNVAARDSDVATVVELEAVYIRRERQWCLLHASLCQFLAALAKPELVCGTQAYNMVCRLSQCTGTARQKQRQVAGVAQPPPWLVRIDHLVVPMPPAFHWMPVGE